MPKDNMALIQKYKETNDPALRDQIIEEYISLVHYALGRLGIIRDNPEYDDLASQGALGLIDALNRFELERETQFTTYATVRIKGFVLDYLRRQDWLSRGARQNVRKVKEAHTYLYSVLKREPTVEEISQKLNIEESKVEQAITDSTHVFLSLDELSDDDEHTFSFHEVVADDTFDHPDVQVEEKELLKSLAGMIKDLPERDQTILSLYYIDELTLKEIGMVLDLSESRVSQVHSQLILSLRSKLRVQMDVDREEFSGRPSVGSGSFSSLDMYHLE